MALSSPLFAIAKGIGVAWDKYKVDKFFAHLDTTLYARAGMASTGANAEATIPDQIRELAKLRDEGLLSDEDFQTKKQELLSRI